MEYLDFQGDIPEGSYGAGNMKVWDTGTYDIEEWEDRKAVVVFHGERTNGKYALFATRGRDWMIHRMDPPADPAWERPPRDPRPMHATTGTLPKTKGWAFELKWSGMRAMVINEPGLTTISDDDGEDVSRAFPEIRRIGRAIGADEVILDGVIMCDAGGDAVQRRLEAKSDSTIRRLARDQPALFVAFDLVWQDGRARWDEPWTERRERLDALELRDDHWQVPAAHIGDGAELVEAARARGIDALVAKRTRSPYTPGKTSDDWRDVAL
jgi:bifunctional non-homologous end joining protein LigD